MEKSQQQPDALERYQKGLKKRLVAGAIAVIGITAALGGGYAAINSGPKVEPSSSPIPSPTEMAPTQTPDVLATPDHFPLNQKTLTKSGINIESYSAPLSETNPYGDVIVLYAPTIEKVQKKSDGSEILTVDFPGGSLKAFDSGRADKNLDGSSTEVVYYGWDTLNNKNLPNTVIKILVNKSPMVQTDTTVYQQKIDFKVGSADWNFVAAQINNPDLLTSLQKTASTTVKLPTINIQVLRPQSS
jgi:hypothetical protein